MTPATTGLLARAPQALPRPEELAAVAEASGTKTLGPIARCLGITYILAATVLGFGVVVTRPLVVYPVLLLPVGMVLLAPRRLVGTIRVVLPLLLFVVWTVASLAWTDSRAATFYELRTSMTLVVGMVVVASLLPMKDLLGWQLRAFEISLIATVVILATSPASRFSMLLDGSIAPAWRGGFIHKNGMATFVALALPAVLAFETRRGRRWGSVVLIVALAAGSNSVTGVIGVGLGLVLWGWLHIVQRPSARDRAHIVMVTVAVVLLCILAGWSSMALVAELSGKDLTLTGRTLIWGAAAEVAKERPLTGYGPGGLYSWPWSEATRSILNQAGFWHNHVHNGLLEVQLALGLVGLALLLVIVTACLSDGIQLLRGHPAVGRWLITSVLLVLVMSMSERTFTGGGWLSMIALMRIVGLRLRQDASSYRQAAAVPR